MNRNQRRTCPIPTRSAPNGSTRSHARHAIAHMARRSAMGLVVLCAALFGGVGTAHAMRCGSHLVLRGDLQARVHALCGTPLQVQKRVEYRVVRSVVRYPGAHVRGAHIVEQSVPVMIEEWVYNRGPSQFMRIVTFENGRIVRIRTGGRGFEPPREPTRR